MKTPCVPRSIVNIIYYQSLRPTFEGRRKVYLDGEDDRVFVLHRGNRLFPLRASETVRITDADPEDDHIELELQSARGRSQ